MSKVSAIIPAYNEEHCLKETIQAVRSLPFSIEIIVVNDGSEDRTGELADSLADTAIHLSKNAGKGKALKEGWKKAKGDYILCLDADLQKSAVEAIHLLEPAMNNEADIIISKIKTGKKSGFGFVKRRAQSIIFKKTGARMEAPLSGQRAFHRRWLPVLLKNNYKGFGVETQMTIDLLRAGAHIIEVETEMAHREMGRSFGGFRHRFKQWVEIERYCKEARP